MDESFLSINNILNAEYNEICCEPVHIESTTKLTQHQANKIISNYHTFGFSIFQFNRLVTEDEELVGFYQKLGLNQPFVPDIYAETPEVYKESGLNHIMIKAVVSNESNLHRAFQTTNSQELHSDGTLEDIGKIKTSTLFCISPAIIGGDNIIFNSVAAFFKLLKLSPDTFCSMLDEKALMRRDIGRTNKYSTGPVFKITNDTIISRFSMDNTCDWEYGFNNVKNLKECFAQLTRLMKQGSPFYIKVKLKKNQGLIMANHKISHGRTSYSYTIDSHRKMIRGLFTVEPTV